MVSCTDCVHYGICCEWKDASDSVVTLANTRLINYPLTIPSAQFPRVAETKDELCRHYVKAKIK